MCTSLHITCGWEESSRAVEESAACGSSTPGSSTCEPTVRYSSAARALTALTAAVLLHGINVRSEMLHCTELWYTLVMLEETGGPWQQRLAP